MPIYETVELAGWLVELLQAALWLSIGFWFWRGSGSNSTTNQLDN